MNNKQSGQENNWKMLVSRMLSLGLNRNQMTMANEGRISSSLHQEALIRSLLKDAGKKRLEMGTFLEDIEFVILDTETTGFHPEHGDEMISIAAAKIVRGSILPHVFHTHIKPTLPISEPITRLTGLSNEDLQSAPDLHHVLPDFLKFVGNRTMIGYHIGHDIAFLNFFLWKNHRIRMTQRVMEIKKVLQNLWNHPFIDLDEALTFFSIEEKGRHTALGDVKMTCKIWIHVLEECRKQNINTLEDFYVRLSKV